MLAEIDFMSKTVTFIILSSRPGLFRPRSVTEVTDTGSLGAGLAAAACHRRDGGGEGRSRATLTPGAPDDRPTARWTLLNAHTQAYAHTVIHKHTHSRSQTPQLSVRHTHTPRG